MSAPTLYFLEVRNVEHGYEIWETHTGQCKGCVPTDPEFVSFHTRKTDVENEIHRWRVNPPLGARLEDVDWDEQPSIPEVQSVSDVPVDNRCGVYYDLIELVLAMGELSNLKPYKIIREDGTFAGYTMELVE